MSITIDPTIPANSEAVGGGLGASRIRGITADILALLGLPTTAPFTVATNPLIMDSAGNLTSNTTLTVPTPSAAGQAANKSYVDAAVAIAFSGITTGAANTYTVTLSPVPATQSSMTDRILLVQFNTANTGPATLNANSLGAQAIQLDGNSLEGGEIGTNTWMLLTWDGANYQIIPGVDQQVGLSELRNLLGTASAGATMSITADFLQLSNPISALATIAKSLSATLNISVSGPTVNGRDASAAYSSTATIHIYAISGVGQTLGLISSLTTPIAGGPTLPTGYNSWAYLASVILVGGNFSGQVLRGNTVYLEAAATLINQSPAVNFTGVTNTSTTSLVPTIAQGATFYASLDCTTGNSGSKSAATLVFSDITDIATNSITLNCLANGTATGLTSGNSIIAPMWNSGVFSLQTSNIQLGASATATVTIGVRSYTVPNNA